MLDVGLNVHHPELADDDENQYVNESLSSITPKGSGYISSDLHAGDSVDFNWNTLTRLRQRLRYHYGEVLLKADVDEYGLIVETQGIHDGSH